VSYGVLADFLMVLSGKAEQPLENLLELPHASRQPQDGAFSKALMSSSPQWIEDVKRAADQAGQDLRNLDWTNQLPENEIATRLAVLRGLLSDYHLFGLGTCQRIYTRFPRLLPAW
jgi:hypothetical protein